MRPSFWSGDLPRAGASRGCGLRGSAGPLGGGRWLGAEPGSSDVGPEALGAQAGPPHGGRVPGSLWAPEQGTGTRATLHHRQIAGGLWGPRFTPHVARGLCPAPLAWPPASRRAPGGPGRGPTGCCHPRRPPTQGCGRESGGPSAGRSRLPAPGARPAASGAGRGLDTAKGGRRWQMSHMRQVVCEA